jgi:ABC-2 type transport system permease protein
VNPPLPTQPITSILFHSVRRWLAVYSVFFQDALVYRGNALIWLMTDTMPAIVMPLVWLSSYNGRSAIHGFTPSNMVVYYMVVLFLTCVVESHIMWDMANDVKNGKFNVYLIRPFSYRGYMYASNVSWRLMRTVVFVPLFAVVLFIFRRWVHWDPASYDFGWDFWVAVVLAHFVSFSISYALGLLGLYVVEVHSIYMFYYLPLVIFSGQMAPLSFFPPKIAALAMMLPFGYTLGFPAQIFIRHVTGPAVWHGFLMQILWIAIATIAAEFLWRGGLKRYTAYGI